MQLYVSKHEKNTNDNRVWCIASCLKLTHVKTCSFWSRGHPQAAEISTIVQFSTFYWFKRFSGWQISLLPSFSFCSFFTNFSWSSYLWHWLPHVAQCLRHLYLLYCYGPFICIPVACLLLAAPHPLTQTPKSM